MSITCDNKYASLDEMLIAILGGIEWDCSMQNYSLMDIFYSSIYMGVDGLPTLKINKI